MKRVFGHLMVLQHDFRPISVEVANKVAECQTEYVLRGFNAEEVAQLDDAVSARPQVSDDIQLTARQNPEAQVIDDLMQRARYRIEEARSTGTCDAHVFE